MNWVEATGRCRKRISAWISLLKWNSVFGATSGSYAINGFRLQTKYYCILMLTLKSKSSTLVVVWLIFILSPFIYTLWGKLIRMKFFRCFFFFRGPEWWLLVGGSSEFKLPSGNPQCISCLFLHRSQRPDVPGRSTWTYVDSAVSDCLQWFLILFMSHDALSLGYHTPKLGFWSPALCGLVKKLSLTILAHMNSNVFLKLVNKATSFDQRKELFVTGAPPRCLRTLMRQVRQIRGTLN